MTSVAIIGGGITGLTTAFRLRQQGVSVTVYEAGGRVGGVIQSLRQDGFLAEFGPNTILETSPIIGSLVRDLGLESRRLYSDPAAENRYLVRNGKLVQLPGSAIKFLATPLFSVGAKLRLFAEPFIPPAPPDREESVAEFVLRRIGREFLDYAINPMVGGVYAGDPARLSVTHAFPKLREVEQRYRSLILGQFLGARERRRRAEVSKQDAKKVSFNYGLQVLVEALRDALGENIRLHSAVKRVTQTPGGWELAVERDGQTQCHTHAALLFAAPAHRLAKLDFQADCGLNLSPLAAIYHPPVASVVLGFRRDEVAHPLDGFGVLIPQIEGFSILGTLFSSSLFPNRAPAGHVTLTSYVGGCRAPELALRSEDELVEMTLRDLRRLLGVSGQPVFRHHVLYPHAIPQYEVGYGRFKTLMNDIEAKSPGVYFAGHYREGISLGDSIISGHRAAERMREFLKLERSPTTAQPASQSATTS